MLKAKKQILTKVRTVPVNTVLNDAIYTLYLKYKLKKSEEDIKNGKVMTIEESKERMRRKYEGFNL